ncbi:major facilitator superfamily domain-containing protein [Bisporella sp. PMI_857]|nr:major facilitator superfamily domain-containing protein [Bisporella sp. PMI_857]
MEKSSIRCQSQTDDFTETPPSLLSNPDLSTAAIVDAEKYLSDSSHDTKLSVTGNSIPPQDRGYHAWVFLLGAAIIEAVTWGKYYLSRYMSFLSANCTSGFPACYGVFRDYFYKDGPFEGINSVAVVGVMSNGFLQIFMPFLLRINHKYPQWRKAMMWLGLVFCVVATIGGAYSKTPAQLIASQGAIYGIGSGLLFAPTINFMSEWFLARRSLAYAIMISSVGIMGTFMPTVFAICLTKYGSRATLLGWTIAIFVLITLSILCIQPRIPISVPGPQNSAAKLATFPFLRQPLFWILVTATVIQGLIHDLPGVYLPSYCTDTHLSNTQGALVLSMLNLASAIAQPLFGLLADYRQSYTSSLTVSATLSSAVIFLIWGFSKALWSVMIFGIVYGGASGGFAVLRSRFAAAVIGNDDDPGQALDIFGALTLSRGVAQVASGFIGAELVSERSVVMGEYGVGKWTRLIVFCGVTMMAANIGVVRWKK